MKHIVLIAIAVLVVLGVLYIAAQRADAPSPDGQTGVDTNTPQTPPEEDVPTEPVENELIRVTSPLPSDSVSSPLTITGEARGMWYFEATFPIVMVDSEGSTIAEGYAEAQGDWMTEEFVPFVSTLTFTSPDSGTEGTVILQKSNASGLPENDDSVEVPVLFE